MTDTTEHLIGSVNCNGSLHCWIHNTDEPEGDDPYMRCFECKHLFLTADELLDATWENDKQFIATRPRETDVTKISFCPHCLHDF